MEKPIHPAKKRLSIGLLIDQATSYYQMSIILGAVEAAKANDVNLICIEGGYIGSQSELHNRRNILYDILDRSEVDGILVLGSVCHLAQPEQIREFCDGFRPLPLVSIAYNLRECGNILVDEATGLRALLHHLIEDHQFKKFAVILGPKTDRNVKNRFAIIQQTLGEHGLSIDERLVTYGDFLQPSGGIAVRTLLDERKADFDVLLSTNDGMAWGALEELRLRGIKVPQEKAVAGFDNFFFSAYSSPPLTTVGHSLFDQGVQSVELLLDMIRNDSPPRDVLLPTRLVIRESCGCFSPASAHGSDADLPMGSGPNPDGSKDQDSLIQSIVRATMPVFPIRSAHRLPELIAMIFAALHPQSSRDSKEDFIKTCYEILRENLLTNEDIIIWQSFLSELRRSLLPSLKDSESLIRLEDMLHQVRVMVAEKTLEREKMNFHESLQHNSVLNLISEELLIAIDAEKMFEILRQKLPLLGIQAGFITVFSDPKESSGLDRHTVLAFDQGGKILDVQADSTSTCLIPRPLKEDDQPHALLLSLLHFAEERFGVIALEINSLNDAGIYDALRRIVSGSMAGVIMTGKIREQEKDLVAQRERLRNMNELQQTMESFVLTLLQTIELKDPYTAGHQHRSAELAKAIASEMGLSERQAEGIRMAGIMHDLGKISVPTEVLVKPINLNSMEIELIREHPKTAHDILKNINFPWPVAQPILQHHERLDGSGYPMGLKGNEISLEAKILAVADVIEAMASDRPYRPALGIDEALAEIEKNRGVLYDPDAVDACVRLFREKGYTLD